MRAQLAAGRKSMGKAEHMFASHPADLRVNVSLTVYLNKSYPPGCEPLHLARQQGSSCRAQALLTHRAFCLSLRSLAIRLPTTFASISTTFPVGRIIVNVVAAVL
eukprot:scaffold7078_cov24-Tisochrysis_lutea.AAC.4